MRSREKETSVTKSTGKKPPMSPPPVASSKLLDYSSVKSLRTSPRRK